MTGKWKLRLTGAVGGLINGLFGGGGGMAVVPLLTRWCAVEEKTAFATCVAVIFPLCVLSAAVYLFRTGFDLLPALPYLLGGLSLSTSCFFISIIPSSFEALFFQHFAESKRLM